MLLIYVHPGISNLLWKVHCFLIFGCISPQSSFVQGPAMELGEGRAGCVVKVEETTCLKYGAVPLFFKTTPTIGV